MSHDLTEEGFVGYIFRGPPERRPRLWFLDRHLDRLFHCQGWALTGTITGLWTVEKAWVQCEPPGSSYQRLGPHIRYQHYDPDNGSWTAVWQLTGVTIPRNPADAKRGFGIHTFGRDDDVWRLGVWPD